MNSSSKLRTKWARLSKRERVIICGAVFLFFVAVLDMLVLGPFLAGEKARLASLKAKQAELAQVVQQRKDLSSEIEAMQKSAVESSNSSASSLDKLASTGGLWRTQQAERWFQEIVAAHGKSLTYVSISSVGISSSDYAGLFVHGIEVGGEMPWLELSEFIKKMGADPAFRSPSFAIDSVDLPGRGISFKAKADVLSDEMIWKNDSGLSVGSGRAR